MAMAPQTCLAAGISVPPTELAPPARGGTDWLLLLDTRGLLRGNVAREAYDHTLAQLAERTDAAVSLAVAIPFCASHCLCCERDIQVAQADSVIDDYVDALIAEFETLERRVGGRRDIWHLHLGGGTATELDEHHIARLMHVLARHWRLPDDADSSVECDPRRVSEHKLRALRESGLRQLLYGLPDLDPSVQRAVGRVQSGALVDAACDMARRAGFDSITLELMIGLPEQAPSGWRATLKRVLELAPERVRVARYQHRPDRAPVQYAIDARTLPSAAECETMAAQAAETLCEAGYRWLGTDLFVLDSDPLAQAFEAGELRRNILCFSQRPPAPILGLGIGATSEIDGHLFRNDTSRSGWRTAVASRNVAVNHAQMADADQLRRRQVAEHMLCTLELPAALIHDGLEAAYQRIAGHAREGLVAIGEDRLIITRAGQHALNVLCAELWDAR